MTISSLGERVTRKGNRHFTLVAGVHSCLGRHLARRELRLLLDMWFEWFGAEEAVKYGLVDKLLVSRAEVAA